MGVGRRNYKGRENGIYRYGEIIMGGSNGVREKERGSGRG